VLGGVVKSGKINFGGSDMSPHAVRDIFVAKLDSHGQHVFSRQFGDRGYVNFGGLAADDRGEVAIVGHLQDGTIDFGHGAMTTEGHRGGYVAKLAGDGRTLWSRRVDGPGDQRAMDVAIDHEGYLIVTGYFRDELVMGDRRIAETGDNLFVMKLAP
jgi:hypothetical protein